MDESPEAPEDDELSALLGAHRPSGPEPSSLEQQLAIASILGAAGQPGEPLQLGRLEVQSKIGGGAMGVVYRAWDPKLERLVAVKLLRGWSDSEERALLAREARALAQLNHPNVVAVYDILDEGKELCFVMEHVAGLTLRAWLDAHPEASWREVLAWFVQVGRGVVAAHDAGIVHQDLKPENVLIGDDGRARVADFGLARFRLDDGALAGGTPHFMAPEVAAGEAATARADQFSFCRALVDALAGLPEDQRAPDELLTAVERGLAPDPEDRYAKLDELLATLERALEQPQEEDRARALVLERVERLWLRGVLERSLEGGAAVELSLASAPELVDSPWAPWGVESPDADAGSRELLHILRESNDALLLVGPPGCGKTTLLLGLCRELWRRAHHRPDAPAPVVLSLSTYQPERRPDRSPARHFARWVVDELVAKYGIPRRAVRPWLYGAGVVLLLDGLDETDPQLRDAVVKTLNAFRAEHPLPMVVACRDSEYEALQEKLAFGGAARIRPLDDEGIAALVEGRHAASRLPRELDDELRAQLRNPLLLTLLCAGGALDEADPSLWSGAYDRYLERALEGCAPAERERLLTRLRYLARTMRAQSITDLWLERLHFGWLNRPWERVAAYAVGVALVFLFSLGVNLSQIYYTTNKIDSSLIFGVGVGLSSFAYTRGRIRPVESLRWSWRRMVRLLPITTVCATAIGLAQALRVNFWANMIGAALTGAILGIVFALDSGDRPGKVRPNAGIRRSLALALATSIGFSIPAFVLFTWVLDPILRRPFIVTDVGGNSFGAGVTVGLFVFSALFLIYGGFTVIMHVVLRFALAARSPLPLDLTKTLDRAVELGLMRRVGGGYVFLHRTLLDYLGGSF